jgi:glycosyltransferase involved in cell wall biosynthesis
MASSKKKLSVLHLVKTSVGATWALQQMRELLSLGVEVHVALPSGGPLASRYKSSGIIVHDFQSDFPVNQMWKCPRILRDFRDLVSKIAPDIIHSHFVGTTLTMRLALGKTHSIPRVFQVPGPLHLEYAFFRNAEILTAGLSDYWIGSCRWTRDCYIQAGIPKEKVFLSYYGVDLNRFSSPENGKLRGELGVGPDVKIVGMVAFMYAPKRYLGQFRGIKGHEDLIDAISLCLKRESNIVAVFVGGAWNKASDYERQVRAYGLRRCGNKAIFLGSRSNVGELYPDFDVAVHPSHSENLGGAAESLLFSVPTIATNVGGFPDLVRQNETGWLVSPRKPYQLADTILQVIRDPVNAMVTAQRGRTITKQLVDARKTAHEIMDTYRSILSRPRNVA